MQSYHHFTLEERECLSEKLKEGQTLRAIAEKLNKNVSSISREIKRNQSKDGTYHPWRATSLYIHRRRDSVRKPLLSDPKIYCFVCDCLDKFWPPEAISARWKQAGGKGLSFTTIYRSIKREWLVGYSPKTYLRRRGKRKNSRNNNHGSIKPVHKIHDRPAIIELRSRLGDLEGDTLYGAIGKGVLLTLVDRTSRGLYAARARSRESDVIKNAFTVALRDKDTDVQSITLDNGSEFAKFSEIEIEHKTTVYFADPHSPWQRGSNENTNGLIRFFFPKGTNFLTVTDEELQYVVDLINNRPRKCLGWLSPNEFIYSKCCT
jgi:IS30 family transposase